MKTYHLTPRFRFFYTVRAVILSLPALWLVYVFRNLPVLEIVIAVILVMGIARTVYWLKKENIVLSEKNITYSTAGIAYETSWTNIEGIKKNFVFVFSARQDCLIVDQSKVKIISTSLWGSFPSPIHAGLNLQKAIIPLSHFADTWRDSDLGRQIKQYAPHLFVDK